MEKEKKHSSGGLMANKCSKSNRVIRHTYKCGIYYSTKDACWVAHSLHTDQIGTRYCVLAALVDLQKGIDKLVDLARHFKDIAVYREAPQDVQRRAERAKPLPHELYGVACKIARGDWPKDIGLTAESSCDHALSIEVKEIAYA